MNKLARPFRTVCWDLFEGSFFLVGVATEVATVTLLDEQDGEVNAKGGRGCLRGGCSDPGGKPHGEAAIVEGE